MRKGSLNLVNAIAKCYSPLFQRDIDPLNEILITIGGDGALNTILTSFLNEGDQVILIEPFYEPCVRRITPTGAVCRYVTLRPCPKRDGNKRFSSTSDWSWDERELESAFNDAKTKAIILNTPSNPLGKVYSREELERVAQLCLKHNVMCISDEVYQHIVFEREHVRIATLPGMWPRTVTIGSVGKIFGCVGAKVGFVIGPAGFIKISSAVQNNQIYCCPAFFQEVVARCFEHEFAQLKENADECYLSTLSANLRAKRDKFASLLDEAGLEPVLPEGGFFILADISKLARKLSIEADSEVTKDVKMVKYLIREKLLMGIPASFFFCDANEKSGENFVRFNFFKEEATLDRAGQLLKQS